MATTKIALSLPTELVAQAKEAVAAGQADSMSAYIAEALTEKAKRDDLQIMMDEMLTEAGGPFSTDERN